jgi:CubicO group peptidase (beta-lactamase class C family)
MNTRGVLVCLTIITLPVGLAARAENAAVPGLPRSTPDAQGVSSAAIRAFVEAADKDITTMHSFMLVRHGHVIAECWWKPHAAETPHVMFSLSKSFMSTGVGLAVAEGKVSLDDPVLKFFPEDAPANPSENLKAMRVRDLLTMSTGHNTVPNLKNKETTWVKAFLAHSVPHKPGTHFLYNMGASYTLSAIVQKVSGQRLLDYLAPRLFEPLGIEKATWETSPQGIDLGGSGLRVRTEDIAKLGQLYLQKGKWNGKQLLPPAWIETATAKHVESTGGGPDWKEGYGFQFWRCRHGAYRGDGANGQFCIVLPDRDAVIAITADTSNMQKELDVVWDKLLPALRSEVLPENPAEHQLLQKTLGNLTARDRVDKKK